MSVETSRGLLRHNPRDPKPSRFRQIVTAYLRDSRGALVKAGLATVGVAAADLLAPWPLKVLVDHVLLGKPASWPLGALIDSAGAELSVAGVALAIVLVALLRGVSASAQLYQTSRIGYELSAHLQRRLFDHLQRLSLRFHSRTRSGELITKLTSDTKNLRDVFAENLLDTAAQLLTLTGMLAALVLLNWRLSLVVLVSFPLLAIAVYQLTLRVKQLSRSQRRLEGALAARISEGLASMPLVQAFGRERAERERFEQASEESLEQSIRTARAEASGARTIETISALGVAAVALFGGMQAVRGELSPGELLIFLTYVGGMYRPIRSLARLSTRFSKGVVSAERIAEILDAEPEVVDRRFAVPAQNLRGHIEFRAVVFGYETHQSALRDISFRVHAGQRVGLVGASGAGKSTVAALLLRFYDPAAGCILVDGVDLRDYQRESLRQQIGAVLQESLLAGATVRENITYGRPDASDAEVEAAARQAQAHEFIINLPGGYDTPIGERGATLSGGQRQRISLARALIKDPAILILDEPTSALDAESARAVEQALHQARRGRTTLVISHHFAEMERFDQILVMRDGVLLDAGTHTELLGRCGYYAELSKLQSPAA